MNKFGHPTNFAVAQAINNLTVALRAAYGEDFSYTVSAGGHKNRRQQHC
jgi:hypothetical protein